MLVLNSGEGAEKNEDKAENSEEDNDFNMDEEKKRKQEEAKKKRAEDLWSSFLCDVGHKPKAPPPAPSTQNTQVLAHHCQRVVRKKIPLRLSLHLCFSLCCCGYFSDFYSVNME